MPERLQFVKKKCSNVCICAIFVVPSTSSPRNGDPFESTVASCSPYAKASIFFDEPNGFLFLCAYISSYASIAAIYPHKIDRILFYSSKKMLECLHMCNFCCTFVADFKLAKYSRF